MALSDYRTALVTGASSGIGRALAAALAGRGLEVHAVARRADRLMALADDHGCHAHALDITDTGALEALCRGREIDVLINGAGMAAGYGALHENEARAVDAVLDVNLRAVLHLLRLVVPGMVARDRGHVVNIGSINGLYAIGDTPVYGAAKAAVHMIGGLLRIDLAGRHVRVTEICPGRVETGFHIQSMGDEAAARKKFYDGRRVLDPEDVAATVLFALEAPAHVNVGLIELTPLGQVPGGVAFPEEPAP
ncbi:MAG: SDR family oxidoreductase [Rhodospirillales bacterium]|jgi:NADP-dependent 3-hydroxy acid dehydrogenase YdfG|nr:SDR family oxidoreductase [Rhodospirillales bacterium]MDP6882621.1 SDR family oxidoreductase [Rhodospirillales bacterium]